MRVIALLVLAVWAVVLAVVPAQAAWEPTRPIEFVIPAGTGGGADQMARLIAGLAEKHKLSPKPIDGRQQGGRRRRRGLPLREGQEGRSAHDHHHPVESVHHAAAHRACPSAGRN